MDSELQVYFGHLKGLPFVRKVKLAREPRNGPASRFDGIVTLETSTRPYSLPFELARSHLSREQAERVIALASRTPDLLLLAPAVGRELGARFEAEKVNFMDRAGNCFVRLDDAFVARVQGNPQPQTLATDRSLRAPAFRVLFALLVKPELVAATTRAIAQASGGVSPQTAADVRARLVEQQLILATARSFRWAPHARRQLLDQWLGGATSTLYPALLIGRFRAPERDPAALEARLAPLLSRHGAWAWGGGAGAQRLTGYYRGDTTTIYLADPPIPQQAAREFGVVPDPRGTLTLVRAPGPLAFQSALDAAHPLLIYTDLLREGHERAREAAEEVFTRHLNELIEGAA